MKQIITLLLIILVSMSVNGQITKQEFENLQAYKFFKPVKKEQKRNKKSLKISNHQILNLIPIRIYMLNRVHSKKRL